MKTRTLFTAFASAQTRIDSTPSATPLPAPRTVLDDNALLNALRNSATDRDQIMQRRIGLLSDQDTV
ncbi:MAG: hypothetical protein ABI785_13345 [Gemmatimonadales bacterium]